MEEKNKQYPEGHFVNTWMIIGIAIFSGIGIPLFIVLKNPGLIAIGPALGVSIGLAIGTAIEAKYKKGGKVRPLTEEERKKRKTAVFVALIVLTALAILGLVMFLWQPF